MDLHYWLQGKSDTATAVTRELHMICTNVGSLTFQWWEKLIFIEAEGMYLAKLRFQVHQQLTVLLPVQK